MNFENVDVYDAQYPAMNVGSQKRPASIAGAPGLSWHRVFWKPMGAEIATWEAAVDDFAAKVFVHLVKASPERQFICPNYDLDSRRLYLFRRWFFLDDPTKVSSKTELESGDLGPEERVERHDVFTFTATVFGCRATIRIGLHTEYWTLTVLTDFSEVSATADADFRAIAKHFDKMADVADWCLDSGNADHQGDLEKHGIPFPQLEGSRSALIDGYSRFWSVMLFDRVMAWSNWNGEAMARVLGGVCGEFFGVLYMTRSPKERPLRFLRSEVRDPQPKRRSEREAIGPRQKLSPATQARSLLGAVWPLVRDLQRPAEKRDSKAAFYGEPEYVACLMQGRSSLYVSTLGAIDPTTRALGLKEPVIYVVVANYRSRWQLGRLVDRLNTLGTLRVAAMRDLRLITSAAKKIRVTQSRVAKLKVPPQTEEARALIAEFSDIGDDIENGLMYRVSRSQYYVSNYHALLDQLRSERIEGFQDYRDFVRRRLFDTFNFISIVARRYREARDELRFVEDVFRTEAIVSTNAGINQTSAGINNLSRSLVYRQEQTNDLLENAEVIIAAPLISAFSMLTIGVVESFGPIDGVAHLAIVAGFTIILGAALLISNRRRKQKRRAEREALEQEMIPIPAALLPKDQPQIQDQKEII